MIIKPMVRTVRRRQPPSTIVISNVEDVETTSPKGKQGDGASKEVNPECKMPSALASRVLQIELMVLSLQGQIKKAEGELDQVMKELRELKTFLE